MIGYTIFSLPTNKKVKDMILILALAAGLLPFNVQFDYPGPQAGKGSVQTESGFLMAGNTALDASGNTQVIFAAYDTDGAFLFTDSFHMGVSTEIYAVQYTDEGIIFTGNWTDPTSGVNAFAYSLSSSYEKLWTYTLELAFHEAFTTAAQGANGDIVCAGSTSSSGAGGKDVLMVALDQDGDEDYIFDELFSYSKSSRRRTSTTMRRRKGFVKIKETEIKIRFFSSSDS